MASAARTPVAALARYAPLAQTLGLMLMIFGLSIAAPLAVSHLLGDGAELAYDEALVLTVGVGALLWLPARRVEGELQIRDGFLLVALAWTLLPAFATLPLMLYLPELSFTDAYFETVSGLTTTGATVLDGLDKLPPSINLWRSQLVWMGGMGVVVLAVAILPLLGVGGAQLFKAETPGADEGHEAHAAHHRDREGTLRRLLRDHDRVHSRAQARRHDVARRGDPCVLDHGSRRLFFARRELRLLGLAGDRGGDYRLHADRQPELRDPFPRLASQEPAALRAATPRRGW